jgi:hypothetical protein
MNSFIEADSPVAAPATGQSIGRSPDGADTDNNHVDFVVETAPTPGAGNL